jgi:hypothetical protein
MKSANSPFIADNQPKVVKAHVWFLWTNGTYSCINIQLKFCDVGTVPEVIPRNLRQIMQPRSQLTYASWRKADFASFFG